MTTATATIPAQAPLRDARPARNDPARERLDRRAALWRRRPLIRDIYRRYHAMIRAARSTVPGTAIELGAGHGSMAEYLPGVLSCDIIPCPWLDCAADAVRLPFRDACLSNIIMIDVLHHVEEPRRFFGEAARTLAPGGRILMVEPYASPISRIAWRCFHEEDFDMSARPLQNGPRPGDATLKDPWEANIAIPTLLFWRQIDTFRTAFPGLAVIRRDRFDLLLYPLSGGFERRQLVPSALAPVLRAGERLISPLAWLLAFRCFVVVEKVC